MWRYETLVLIYALAGLAVWTWVIRNYHPRARRRTRGSARLRRRQRVVESLGVGSIAVVAVVAAALGFVDVRGIALVFGVLVAGAQAMAVLAFQERFDSFRPDP